MMDYRDQLKVQGYLDGELSAADARRMAERLARDPNSASLLQELRQTRDCLVQAQPEAELQVRDSRAFYWSRIQREIQRQETALPPARQFNLARLRRWLFPATGLAVAAVVCLLVLPSSPSSAPSEAVETALSDSGAFTYHDYSAGATLVWLSYPADNEVADQRGRDTLE